MPGYQYRGTGRDTIEAPEKTPTRRLVPDSIGAKTKPATAPKVTVKADTKTFTDGPVPTLGVKAKAPAKLPVWEEPPARSTTNSYVATVIEELKKNPGKWARVKDGLKNAGGPSTWTKRGCEAVTRRQGDTWSVWARWPEEAE